MTITDDRYAMRRVVSMGFEEAVTRVQEALAGAGFGVLADIDMAGTLRKKLGVEMAPYRVLGACNPPLAHQALEAESDIGLLLPCNVAVYAGADEGTTVVAAIDPVVQLGVAERPELRPVALEVRDRLRRMLQAV